MSGIMVTGATTPLGESLIRHLLKDSANDHVLAVGLEREGLISARGRLSYLATDLTRSRNLRDILFGPARDAGIETVIHTSLHRSAHAEGRHVRRLNVETTQAMLALCEAHPTIRRLVFKSSVAVYQTGPGTPTLIDERRPFDLDPGAPQWVRDRVEADVAVSARMGLSKLNILILRFAELLAPDSGSQLCDYLSSWICLRPFGFDPMLNVISIEDATRALALAARADETGAFNIPGADTLPLSETIRLAGRVEVSVPGPLLAPLYNLRATARGLGFRYDLNRRRFHFSAVVDGRRAQKHLGYSPRVPIDWASLRA